VENRDVVVTVAGNLYFFWQGIEETRGLNPMLLDTARRSFAVCFTRMDGDLGKAKLKTRCMVPKQMPTMNKPDLMKIEYFGVKIKG